MSNQNDNPSFLYKLWVIISYHSKKKIKATISSCKAKREARRTSGKSISLKKIAIISGIILAALTVLAAGGAIATHIWLSRNYYDNSRAIAMLNANARSHSKGLCAMYVRSALEGGGVPTFGFPGNACEYFDFLPRLDFKEIATHKSKKYEPKAGDIMVFAAQKGHRSGHIAMYNGKMWVSDFKQPKGIWVARVYQDNPNYKVYRRKDGWSYRSISLEEYKLIFSGKDDIIKATKTRWKRTKERLEKTK